MGLLGIGLVAYDLQLNAAFRKTDFTKPFYNYERLPFSGFDHVRVNSAGALNAQFVQGDFQVKVNPRLRDWLKVEQQGTQLIITARFSDHVQGFPADYALFVSCPKLTEIETSGRFLIGGKVEIDSSLPRPWFKPTRVVGFKLDSLKLSEIDGGNLVLEDNKIGNLQARIGTGSSLTIEPGNTFGSGEIWVPGKGQLTLMDTNNLQINHYLSDSATLILNGAAAKHVLKLNQP